LGYRLWLGHVTAFIGAADDLGETRVAGRFGFKLKAVAADELPLYARLRHYACEADVLAGGTGDDILVAGTTAYDVDPASLAAIMAE
jgi:hypothetical protein